MSTMMERLHRIREEHAKELEDNPQAVSCHLLPTRCSHCGGPFPAIPVDDPHPGYRILGVTWGDSRQETKARLESPPCPDCGKTTTFEY